MPEAGGTLYQPEGEGACSVCGSLECEQFHEAPYPEHYPFLPGGYRVGATYGPPDPPPPRGHRTQGLRCS